MEHKALPRFKRLSVKAPVSVSYDGDNFVRVSTDAIAQLSEAAFAEVSYLFRADHLRQLRKIIDDADASENDRYVALELLKNAVIAAEKEFPSCQDTGTAIVAGSKGQNILIEGDMQTAIERGILATWDKRNLRFSQMAPLDMFAEQNTGTNLPAQIDIAATTGSAIELMFMAKGGGSANKTFLFQETRRLLEEDRMLAYFKEKIATLGTTACPPYHLALVVGGLSAEQCLKTVKLASARMLDDLPTTGDAKGRAFRDVDMEEKVLDLTRNLGIGAQFGGKYFCHDIRVIRLPRHGGSLPVGMGVSCSADRQIRGRIDADGVWLEELESDPSKYLPEGDFNTDDATHLDLDQPMEAICAQLSSLKMSSAVLMTGTMIVARDMAHAEFAKMLSNGDPLPAYLTDHPIYYAGPAKTPKGRASGSFGPTTAARMDPYVPNLQAHGASRVMIAKGNRSKQVINSCKDNGGFFLGSVGGAAAKLGRDVIKSIEVIDFPEFGMEAVHKIRVENFPAFVVIDDKGNDFFTRQPHVL